MVCDFICTCASYNTKQWSVYFDGRDLKLFGKLEQATVQRFFLSLEL